MGHKRNYCKITACGLCNSKCPVCNNFITLDRLVVDRKLMAFLQRNVDTTSNTLYFDSLGEPSLLFGITRRFSSMLSVFLDVGKGTVAQTIPSPPATVPTPTKVTAQSPVVATVATLAIPTTNHSTSPKPVASVVVENKTITSVTPAVLDSKKPPTSPLEMALPKAASPTPQVPPPSVTTTTPPPTVTTATTGSTVATTSSTSATATVATTSTTASTVTTAIATYATTTARSDTQQTPITLHFMQQSFPPKSTTPAVIPEKPTAAATTPPPSPSITTNSTVVPSVVATPPTATSTTTSPLVVLPIAATATTTTTTPVASTTTNNVPTATTISPTTVSPTTVATTTPTASTTSKNAPTTTTTTTPAAVTPVSPIIASPIVQLNSAPQVIAFRNYTQLPAYMSKIFPNTPPIPAPSAQTNGSIAKQAPPVSSTVQTPTVAQSPTLPTKVTAATIPPQPAANGTQTKIQSTPTPIYVAPSPEKQAVPVQPNVVEKNNVVVNSIFSPLVKIDETIAAPLQLPPTKPIDNNSTVPPLQSTSTNTSTSTMAAEPLATTQVLPVRTFLSELSNSNDSISTPQKPLTDKPIAFSTPSTTLNDSQFTEPYSPSHSTMDYSQDTPSKRKQPSIYSSLYLYKYRLF